MWIIPTNIPTNSNKIDNKQIKNTGDLDGKVKLRNV